MKVTAIGRRREVYTHTIADGIQRSNLPRHILKSASALSYSLSGGNNLTLGGNFNIGLTINEKDLAKIIADALECDALSAIVKKIVLKKVLSELPSFEKETDTKTS